jgi:putative tricarboxylic transport membrane protein
MLFASLLVAITFTFPPFPGQRFGPSLFPRLLGAGLFLCGLVLVTRGLAARRGGEAWFAPADWLAEQRRVRLAFASPVAILIYILIAERLGFILTAALLLAGLFLLYRVRPPLAVFGAIVATLIIEWFFGYLFRVPLPLGILPNQPSYALMNFLRTLF